MELLLLLPGVRTFFRFRRYFFFSGEVLSPADVLLAIIDCQ